MSVSISENGEEENRDKAIQHLLPLWTIQDASRSNHAEYRVVWQRSRSKPMEDQIKCCGGQPHMGINGLWNGGQQESVATDRQID